MCEKELLDETLDINSTNNYEISIQISLNRFSFSLLDIFRNKFVMFRSYSLNAKETEFAKQFEGIISKDDFLKKEFHAQRLVYVFEKNTLIPTNLYDPAVVENYFSINHSLDNETIVLSNKINNPDSYLLFDVRKQIHNTLKLHFPEATISHHIKTILFSAFTLSGKSSGSYLGLNVEDEFFNIVIIENYTLKFLNTFRYRSNTDILYFLMHTLEQLGITNKTILSISGNIDTNSELYNSLLKYVNKLVFVSLSGDFSLSYVFDSLPLHKYANLFNVVNCE